MPLQPTQITDPLERRRRLQRLADRYGALLSPAQAEVVRLHLDSDWSMAEIAASRGTSRPAVHDALVRALAALERYEILIGAVAREEKLERRIDQLNRRLDRARPASAASEARA